MGEGAVTGAEGESSREGALGVASARGITIIDTIIDNYTAYTHYNTYDAYIYDTS
jgi:hypothetical protein